MDDRTDAVLDAIDGALWDWDHSPDAMRWQPPESQVPLRGDLDVDWAAFGVSVCNALAPLVAFAVEWMRVEGAVIKALGEALTDAGVDPIPPADLKARALCMRQNRNTGPKLRPTRALRHLPVNRCA